MRILMVSNKIKTYPLLYRNIIEPLQELGHSIVWAADFSGFEGDRSTVPCVTEQIPIHTNPFHGENRAAYRRLKELIGQYEIEAVLCSTPIGGTLARLAAKSKGISPVVYEAHGFLFFKGAPLINRTVYRLQELWLAHYTDALITITEEDYAAAQRFRLRSGRKPYLVHGAGVRVGMQVDIDGAEKRKALGVPDDAFILLSAGELNKNKNTQVIVRALAELKERNVYYLACGVGPEQEALAQLARTLGVEDRFRLLGYRTDVAELMAAADLFVMPSFREGIPRSILEAMDLGLPCVGSDTRGIRDLIDDGKGGYICKATDVRAFAGAIEKLAGDAATRRQMGEYNREKVKPYAAEVVRDELKRIYAEVLH